MSSNLLHGEGAPETATEKGELPRAIGAAWPPLPGAILLDRYQLQSVIGEGGCGMVFRAKDTLLDREVAVKTTLETSDAAWREFDREIRLLARLPHPAIVQLLDHGRVPLGGPVLVMELLFGHTLREELQKGAMAASQACRLVARVLGALAFAHDLGIVHRDLKPSNVFLVQGSAHNATLLDFGVAHERTGWQQPSRSGVGTPLYMAPEQASGDVDIDGRADVFAAGCLLVECITGRPLFQGLGLAPFAKAMLSERVVTESALARVPPHLRSLAHRMLASRRDERPSNAAALAAQLLSIADELSDAPVADVGTWVGPREARSLAILLVRLPGRLAPRPRIEDMQDVVAPWGGTIYALPGDVLLGTFGVAGNAVDQTTRAANAALALRAVLPHASMALSLARATVEHHELVGPAIDESVRLLEGAAVDDDASAIELDDNAAALLADPFVVDQRQGGAKPTFRLLRKASNRGTSRTVLGKAVPFVGRERELALITASITKSWQQEQAHVALITAPAGGGKSRLMREVVDQVSKANRPVLVLSGHADDLRSGAPYGLITSALASATEITAEDTPPARQRKLNMFVGSVAQTNAASDEFTSRVASVLGELLGARFPDHVSTQLRAIRQEPRLLADQVHLAWIDLLAAASTKHALILVAEDLHWGDAPSLHLLESSVRTHADRALFVLATARPEVEQRFPDLWSKLSRVTRFAVPQLDQAACVKLASGVFPAMPEEQVQLLADRCQGNPFFLEELLRAAASQTMTDAPAPRTILAALQARLDAVGEDGKQVLRAASVFGERFRKAAVEALLDPRLRIDVPTWLELLEAREILMRENEQRERWAFRHALVRDAAYDALTDIDRRTAHQGAAVVLQDLGEQDAGVIAEHWERGGKRENAGNHWRIAAEQALAAHDVTNALQKCDRADAAGLTNSARGLVLITRAKIADWKGQWLDVEQAAAQALDLVDEEACIEALCERLIALGQLARWDELKLRYAELRARRTTPPTRKWMIAALRSLGSLTFSGDDQLVRELLLELFALSSSEDKMLNGLWWSLHSLLAMPLPEVGIDKVTGTTRAVQALLAAGDLNNACINLNNLTTFLLEAGRATEAEQKANELLALCRRVEHRFILPFAHLNLAQALLSQGRQDAARPHAEEAAELGRIQGDPRIESFARFLIAQAAMEKGDVVGAEDYARAALELAQGVADVSVLARAVLLRVLMPEHPELGQLCTEVRAYLQTSPVPPTCPWFIWVSLMDGLKKIGQQDALTKLMNTALEELDRWLKMLPSAEHRRWALDGSPDIGQLVRLGRELQAPTSIEQAWPR
ncbi:MAG: protein kinase [Deltaproteobacteria bacterium]|nr:protein kinase [Deltaproteobacteria bacterium]